MTERFIRSRNDGERHIRVVLVEDNPGDVELIRQMLQDSTESGMLPVAFDLRHFENLSDGLEDLLENKTDIILLDLGLPDSCGLETLERVLENQAGIPVIVMTGLDDESVGITAVKRGAQDYLLKGEVDLKVLVRAIHYALGRNQLVAKLALYNNRLQRALDVIHHDLEVAAAFQRSLLPPSSLPIEGFEIAWRYRPSGKLGGDLLNVEADAFIAKPFNADEVEKAMAKLIK